MAASSEREVAAEIEREIRRAAEVKVKSKAFAEKVRDEVRAETPVRTGKAAASVHVEKRRDRDGLPHWWVGTRLWYFHFIEGGTGADTKQGSPFGPDTPTEEYAPFAKVAHRHGGSVDGIEADV